MCRMKQIVSTHGSQNDPDFLPAMVSKVISGPSHLHARDRAQARARFQSAWHASPRKHDKQAGPVCDRSILDHLLAKASFLLRVRKLLGPHDGVVDTRPVAPTIKTRRQYGHLQLAHVGR